MTEWKIPHHQTNRIVIKRERDDGVGELSLTLQNYNKIKFKAGNVVSLLHFTI